MNNISRLDYPDPDIIRVNDTYYMVSTTMYFMPGCEILRSYDLVNWEHATYVYDRLDSTPAQCLEGKENVYGQGMWAASLRYHEGKFYICFVANDTHKTYVYTSEKITGPWKKSSLNGFYHDNSILFDDDGKVYIISGNRQIHIKELTFKDSEDGDGRILSDDNDSADQIIITDSDDAYLGYEGAHFYKINGKYYIFLIHMPKSTGRRTESCFVAENPYGPYHGIDVMDDTMGYRGSGVAQGGIVESPDGKWYAVLFQDSGSVGRIPILMPVSWNETSEFPTFGDNGVIPTEFETKDLRPGYEYTSLVGSDDFKDLSFSQSSDTCTNLTDSFGFKSRWQFNHEPDLSLIKRNPDLGTVTVTTGKLCDNLVQAKNTLTQRALFPACSASVIIDASNLNDGDYAGLCVLESSYGFIGITKENGQYFLVNCSRAITTGGFWGERHDTEAPDEMERIPLDSAKLRLGVSICFDQKKKEDCPAELNSGLLADLPDDTAQFSYSYENDNEQTAFGPRKKLEFKLDHFTGARLGLFFYSTQQTGGSAVFSEFNYRV